MKVFYKFGIGAMSGTLMELVHCPDREKQMSYGRRWARPKYTANNALLGSIGRNLGILWHSASADYRADFALYAKRYKVQHDIPNAPGNACWSPYPLFTKMMFAWQQSDPLHVDLATVTINDIVTLDASVRTVEKAIDAGFIQTVTPYDDLNHDIQ